MADSALHIGIDIDGVLADYMAGVAAVGQSMGLTMDGSASGPTKYGLVEPGWFPDDESASKAMTQLRDSGGLRRLALLDAGAAAAIRRLRIAGHRVSIVTARHSGGRYIQSRDEQRIARETIDWLTEHEILPDDLRFERRKSVVGCQIYIDDAPQIIEELRQNGRRAVVYDQPYNRHLPGERVSNLTEFAELVLAAADEPKTVGAKASF